MKVLVVGARSPRQGTGPFIAGALRAAGAEIAAVVGTTEATVAEATANLEREQAIRCRGYTDLEKALDRERPAAVALCSPWRVHREQLPAIARAGCHCLAEKPLVWPATQAQFDTLADSFVERGLLLQVVAQWPATLAVFEQLHGPLPASIRQFSMRLSPISIGPDMITDAAPHFISMLQALLGPGECTEPALELSRQGDAEYLRLACGYRHRAGQASAQLELRTCPQRPRPAWYQVNDLRVDREVELPHYQQYLRHGQRRRALPDPMRQVADRFVAAVGAGKVADRALLDGGHANLLRLAQVWPQAK